MISMTFLADSISSSPLRYLFAITLVGIALVATLQIPLVSQRTPFAFFFVAVMVASHYGGRNPGLVVIGMSALASDYFVLPPRYSFRLDAINFLEELVFISVALLLVYLISAQRQTERSLRSSEERYRIIAETASDGIVTIDQHSRILFINRALEKIFGYKESEILNQSLTQLMPSYLRDVHRAGIARYVETGKRHLNWNSIEITALHKSGHEFPVELSFGESNKNGERHFTGIIRDITDRKRVERERERFFAVSGDLLVIAGFDGYFKWVSPTWERSLGWTSEELLSQPSLQLVHPDDHEKTIAEAENLSQGKETISFENRYRHKDGSYRWISWRARPYLEEQQVYAAAMDITERRSLEDQLQHSQKLESIGQLAGGVAHDFNNLLTVISGYTELSLGRLAEPEALKRNLGEINRAADRAAALTRQLLAFSRKQVLQPKALDLTETVQNMDKLLRRLIGEDIKLVTRLEADLSKVLADPGQIEQVIMNLALNARDAMPQGGNITIETQNVFLDDAYIRQHMGVTPGPYVMLAVSDTGHGMDAKTLSRIFEPFFTTKEAGKGTGLGLSMVYGIIRQSGGNLWVYSEPGHGTTFKIYLPLAKEQGEQQREIATDSGARVAGETVLIVEDEDAVRNLLLSVLQPEGYTVLAAASGQEALQLCQTYEGSIHLLMTDVVMPGMSGPELVKRLVGKCRKVRVLYMSGYTDNAIVHHGVLDPGIAFLEKPFTPLAALRKVREVLESDAGTP